MSCRILLPFDGSPAALRAADLVAGYAGERARLAPFVLNVQSPPVRFWPEGAIDAGALHAALLDEGSGVIKPAVERLAAAGFAVDHGVRLGMAADTILKEALARQAELIVMGTRGHGALQGYALGSVALRVAHGSGPPVLLVKPEDRLPGGLGRRLRVLLAMDGSEPALRAAGRLAAWRWLGELEVHLVYVQQPLPLLQAMLPPHDDVIAQWSPKEGEQAAKQARELFAREGIAHHLHLTVGDPALEVRTLAEQTSSDLVALGTRGRGAAHHALIGSVALKSATLCPVPVLLVP